MKLFLTKYRVVRSKGPWYSAQFRHWYMPFWMDCFGVNVNQTIREAMTCAQIHRHRMVWVAPDDFYD